MQVAIFGATGRTGALVLSECESHGWQIRALVRNPAALDRRGGHDIVEGDSRSLAAVQKVVNGSDAVFCCLGMSDISVPATDFSDGVRTIVQAMKDARVRRLVAIGSSRLLAQPARETAPGPAAGEPAAAAPATEDPYANIAAEHRRNYETLQHSGLDWTLMCPIMLVDDIPAGSGKYAYENLPPGGTETGYADLAHTMVKLIPVAESIGKRVGIASYRYVLR